MPWSCQPQAELAIPSSASLLRLQLAANVARVTDPKTSVVAKPAKALDCSKGIVTAGGGVAATIQALRRTRGTNKNPTKEQVAIRIDRDVLSAFPSSGPGWPDTHERGAEGVACYSATEEQSPSSAHRWLTRA
jgi:uncharacterized protein (DUF4415 family)